MSLFPEDLCSEVYDDLERAATIEQDEKQERLKAELVEKFTEQIRKSFACREKSTIIEFPDGTSKITILAVVMELASRFRKVEYWRVVHYAEIAEYKAFDPKRPCCSWKYRITF